MLSFLFGVILFFGTGFSIYSLLAQKLEWDFKPLSQKVSWLGSIVGIIAIILMNGVFFTADQSEAYALQNFSGKSWVVTGNGIKPRLFSNITSIDKEISIKTLKPEHYALYKEGDRPESSEVYVVEANWNEFIDKIPVALESSILIDVNPLHEGFKEVLLKGKTEENIVYSRLLPLINQAQGAVVKLMTSEDYISGGKVQLDYYLQDQLQNGLYKLEKIPVNSNVRDDNRTGDTTAVTGVSKELTHVYRIKEDSSGNPERVEGKEGLGEYGFNVKVAAVETQQWTPEFETYLEGLLAIEATTQKNKRAAKAAKFEAEKNEAEARANVIKERGVKEKEQVSKLIAAETKAKEANYKLEEENNLLAAARVKKERVAIEAINVSKMRQAGVDPLVRLEKELANRVEVANAIFGGKAYGNLTTSIGGGQGKSGTSSLDTWVQYLLGEQLKNK